MRRAARWCLQVLLMLPVLLVTVRALGPTLSALAQTPGGAAQEYRVGAKDVLKVTVWGHDDLSRQVVVSADGTFQFPLVGDVRVAGLTPGEIEARLRDLLEKDYSSTLKFPSASRNTALSASLSSARWRSPAPMC